MQNNSTRKNMKFQRDTSVWTAIAAAQILLAGLARPADAELTRLALVIDSTQSFVAFSGDIEGVLPLAEQVPGSLTTALQGTFDADLIGTAGVWSQIRFLSSGQILAVGHLGSALPGNAPADLAYVINFDDETNPLLGYAALRASTFQLTSGFDAIDSSGMFSLGDLFATLSGTFDYDIFGQAVGSSPYSLTGQLNGQGTIAQIKDTLYLTIPIDVSFHFPGLVNGLTLNHYYTGQIVASAHVVPEPSTLALVGVIATGGIVLQLRRRSNTISWLLSPSWLVGIVMGQGVRRQPSRRTAPPMSSTIAIALFLVSLGGWTAAKCRAEPLKVMSFNILMAALEEGPENHWFNPANPADARRLTAFNVIRDEAPDILGLQEVSTQQLADLNGQYSPGEGLLEYDHYAVDPGINGYFTAIYYRSDRFSRVDQGAFSLTTTPDVLQTWRTTTWVVLADSQTGQQYFVVSTHLDPFSTDDRTFGGELIQSKLQELAGGLPTLVTGDFNAPEASAALLALTAPAGSGAITLSDPYRQLHPVRTLTESTGSNFTGLTFGARIDFVLSSADFLPESASIVRTSYNGRYPSDHYPVTVAFDVAMVPEPSTFGLAAVGMLGLFALRKRRR
jgi:endonuclease/exonuclease/phosphatase family metal-dependent hydrolase